MTTIAAPALRTPTSLDRRLAQVSLAAAGGFTAIVVAAGLRDPGYSPRSEAISALGSTESHSAGLMTAGFLCLATVALASGAVLFRALKNKTGKAAGLLVVVGGLLTVVCGFARQSCSTLQQACLDRESAGDVATSHWIHNLAALPLFAFLAAAGFLLASALRRDARFAHLSRRVRLAAAVAALSVVWFGSNAFGDNGGLVERLMVLLTFGLPAVVALRITRDN